MQIVIDIPEEDFKIMKHNIAVGNPLCPLGQEEMVAIVANGTPLPKGHGELIDRNELNKDLITNEWITDYDGGGLEEILFNAPTIIEADTESEDKK